MGYFKPRMVYFGVEWPIISSYLAVQVGIVVVQYGIYWVTQDSYHPLKPHDRLLRLPKGFNQKAGDSELENTWAMVKLLMRGF